MTIDLGFAWFTLPDGEEIGIVDVPGHRDFIENMLAGVSGIDAALLVIAADEGVMPQTREHLAILDLLQVQTGMVVLTKTDLIDDPAWFELVEGDIRTVLRGTVLQDAPIVRVSSRSRAGFPELLKSMSLLLKNVPARPDFGRPRLPVDRVFSIAGFGTVVTGTLSDGRFSAGDEVEILPSSLRARIRGLQTHKKKEETAVQGSRTAVNLSGVDLEQIHRGDVIVHPGQYHPTQRIDVRFRLLPGSSTPLRHDTEIKLFLGASETIADVRLLGVEALNPGETGWLQLEMRTPIVAVRGDRYILRRPSPGETLGGGTVVDPHPKARHKRFDESVLKNLETMAQGSPAEMLLQASLVLGPALVREVIARSRLENSIAETALQELINSGQLIHMDGGPLTMEGVVISAVQFDTLRQNVVSFLVAYHKAYPLRRGMPREELKSRLKLHPRAFNLFITRLMEQGTLASPSQSSISWTALPDHIVRFSPPQQVKVDKLMKMFGAAPFAPPSVKECLAEVGEDVFAVLVDSGDLVQVSAEVIFRKGDYETMVEKVRQSIQQKEKVTLAEVRDLLQTSRKYVQALLEHLDSVGVTVRDGDFRRLK